MDAKWSGKSLMCLQLSNSGDILKHLVLNDGLKAICGCDYQLFLKLIVGVNNSCIVISQMMNEREIEYRGSKSVIMNNVAVKEQRVDGSWQEKKIHFLLGEGVFLV